MAFIPDNMLKRFPDRKRDHGMTEAELKLAYPSGHWSKTRSIVVELRARAPEHYVTVDFQQEDLDGVVPELFRNVSDDVRETEMVQALTKMTDKTFLSLLGKVFAAREKAKAK